MGTFAVVEINENSWKLLERPRPGFQELGYWEFMSQRLGKKEVNLVSWFWLVKGHKVTFTFEFDVFWHLQSSGV